MPGRQWFMDGGRRSGKGLSAALVVSMLRAYSQVLFKEDLHPVAFLNGLSKWITPELPPTMFITASAGDCTPMVL